MGSLGCCLRFVLPLTAETASTFGGTNSPVHRHTAANLPALHFFHRSLDDRDILGSEVLNGIRDRHLLVNTLHVLHVRLGIQDLLE